MKSFVIGLLIVAVALPVQASAPCYPVKGYGHYQSYVKPYVYYVPGYQVGSALREEAIAEKAADKMRAAMEADFAKRVSAMRAELQAEIQGEVTLRFGAKSGEGHQASGDTGKVQAIFNNHCVSCHEGPGAKKGLDLSDASALSPAQLMKSALKAYRGTMPPAPADPIPPEEADVLLKAAEQIK